MPRARLLVVAGFLLFLPAGASAQSAVAGLVTDTTGALLPGVSVEASSPALIEGARVATTDGQGRYAIEALVPGTYRVTFVLQGFSTTVREGILLTTNFTAPVNAQMSIGALEESITVTGAAPLVDVQRTTVQQVLTRDVLDVLPTGRNNWSIGVTLPAITTRSLGGGAVADVGGLSGGQQAYLTIHGSAFGDSSVSIDGIPSNGSKGGGNNSQVYWDDGAFQEVAFETVGGTAESMTSGVVINMIPKDGANRFSGSGLATYSNDAMYSTNVTEDLRVQGLLTPSSLNRLWDYNLSNGGPLRSNRVWYFASVRFWGTDKTVPLTFNQPGVSEPGQNFLVNKLDSYLGRITTQVTQRNKVAGFFAWMGRHRPEIQNALGPNPSVSYAPSGTMRSDTVRPYVGQIKWTSTLSDRLLAEAAYSVNHYHYYYTYQEFIPPGAIKRVDTVRSNQWGAGDSDSDDLSELRTAFAKFSYVTGSHSMKVGVQFKSGFNDIITRVKGDLFQQYQNGVPFQVTVSNTPIDVTNRLDGDLGIFAQDQYTVGRLTMNGGLRFDRLESSIPRQTAEAGRFVPARTFDARDVPVMTSWSPRVGVAYDLFGDGRTALKFSYGRYQQQEATGLPSRYNPMGTQSDPRTWVDLNGDDIAQDNEIGASRNAAFGLASGNVLPGPDLERAHNDLISGSAQHQLVPGVAVAAAYYYRRYGNIRWTNNVLVTHDDYAPIPLADPRGNGQMLTVYNLAPGKVGQVSNIDLTSDNTSRYYGFDVTLSSRFGKGGTVIGGFSAGRTRGTTCQVPDPNQSRNCDQATFDIPFEKTYKLTVAYPLLWGIRASGVFQSAPGLARQISYLVTRAQIPTLTLSSVTLSLSEPGSVYLPRMNQVDLKFGRTFKDKTTRIQPDISIFNVTNDSTVLSRNNSFGPTLDRAQSILDARLIRFGVQINF